MQILSLLAGIASILLMIVGFIPLLGLLNWINIPLSGLGLIFSVIAFFIAKEGRRSGSIAGIICCGIAILVGMFRLMLGGGIL